MSFLVDTDICSAFLKGDHEVWQRCMQYARLSFNAADCVRMNALAAKNRAGELTADEDQELTNYIRVGQTLGILQSKARRSLQRGPRRPGTKPTR